MAGIFKITNRINGHVYIGNAKNPKRELGRFKNNKNTDIKNHPVCKDIEKYGNDKFDFSVLEECTAGKIKDRQIYYINLYDAKEIEPFPRKPRTLGNGLVEHTKKMKTDPQYREKIIKKYKNNRPNAISVDMIDKDTGERIRQFPKLMDGAAWIRTNTKYAKADYATINKVCKGTGKTAYGYRWRYTKNNDA
jgi:group I intron endonuclease